MKERFKLWCVVALPVVLAIGGLGWWVSTTAVAASKAVLDPDPQAAVVARLFARTMPRVHLSHQPLNEGLATNAVNLYLSTLDYDHTFFTGGDIDEFRNLAGLQAEALQKGDVAFAFRVFERLRERVRNRVEYVNSLLDKGFDMTVGESYVWKRKDAPWAVDEAAWNNLWRQKVKNEYVARVVSRRLAEEDRTNAVTGAVHPEPQAGLTNRDEAASLQSGLTNQDEKAMVAAAQAEANLSPEDFIRKRYVQYLTVLEDSDADFVLQRYFSAFAQAYDPHSEYMTPSSTEDFDIGMKLSLVGIGALLASEDGAARIERLIPGGPAERDGRLKAGDKIIAVAQGDKPPVDILHWPLYKAVRIIRGEKGTKVVLTVIPAADISGGRVVKIDLMRDEVKLEEQEAKGEVNLIPGPGGVTNRVGVIRLPAFYADMRNRINGASEYKSSTRDVARLVEEMKSNGVQGIILDLRSNGGGSLAEAVEMTGLFLKAGPVVQVRESRGIQVLSDPDPSVLYVGPLVVLVNRQSASASEILAAALLDYGRAVIVGDSKTHGKGTVQSWQNLDERNPRLGSLKVTTHSFYRVAGGSTQLKGVVPDIIIPSVLDAIEIGEEFLPNAMGWTVVNMAQYRPVADLGPLITDLRRGSEARRAKDSRFTAQAAMIQRIRQRMATSDISLNLQERLALAREEKGMEKMQAEALGDTEFEAEEAGKKDKNSDFVLKETERIVVDLTALMNKREQAKNEN
ncbi:MAG: carboxy terminal-processing peptidase [bacterium]